MLKLKRIVAVVLLLLVVGLNTPQVFADGPSEIPGITSGGPSETPGLTGPSETPGLAGPSATSGFFDTIISYLVSTLIP